MEGFTAQAEGRVLHVTFGRDGELNLMDDAWFGELDRALGRAQADDEVRIVLLSARGPGFCAGADLRRLQAGPGPEVVLGSGFARCLHQLAGFDKPLVAAVSGAAIGGGSTLLLHCDFAYATAETRFQLPFTQIGIVPELGCTHLLPLFAGMRLASELLLLGRPFDAATAVRAGIVNELVTAEALLPRARETAEALAALPPGAMRATKRVMKAAQREGVTRAFREEGQALEACFAGEEVKEACSAFLAKRKPDFSRFK